MLILLLMLQVLLFWLPAAECPFPQVPSTVRGTECGANDRVLSTVLSDTPNLARIPLLAWQPIPSSTSSITGPAHTAYIPQPAADYLVHDTARCTMLNPLLTLQVLLFWLPAAECPFPQVPSTIRGVECAANDRVLGTVFNDAPNLARIPLLAWQPIPSSTSSITGPAHAAYIP
ncbi:hypothetical protein V5799_012642 [Amblyomma americanum]|uniref:Secreted protein n=1 Tax=Amblyomma americanum TaxID=6943 RepID=A0AAQ4EDJ3_AMBAM